MSYFVNRADELPRRGKGIVPVVAPEEKGSGRRRNPIEGDVLPSRVGRGETRDEVLERKVAQYQQQTSMLPPDPSIPEERVHKKIGKPSCADSDSSSVHIFGPPKAELVPPIRLRPNNADDEKMRAIWAPPDTRKDAAVDRFALEPTMVERMMSQNFPLPHPSDKGPGGRSARTDRNASQISIGGFVPPGAAGAAASGGHRDGEYQYQVDPSDPSRHRAYRKRVDVDYNSYVPDLIQAKAYYAVDGRKVAAEEGAAHLKNFFTGEPLLCGKFIAEKQHVALPQPSPRSDIPEPPSRRSFEHGLRPLQ